jgi:hypothetical protein
VPSPRDREAQKLERITDEPEEPAAQKRDGCEEDACEEQKQDNNERVLFILAERVIEPGRQKSFQDMAPIQGGQGNEVEDRQDKIDPDCIEKEIDEEAGRAGVAKDEQRDEAVGPHEDEGQEKIGAGPGQSGDGHIPFGVLEVSHVDGNGFGPAEPEQHNENGAHRVNMNLGVQSEAFQVFGGGVPQPVSQKSVGQFMDGQGHKQNKCSGEQAKKSSGEIAL